MRNRTRPRITPRRDAAGPLPCDRASDCVAASCASKHGARATARRPVALWSSALGSHALALALIFAAAAQAQQPAVRAGSSDSGVLQIMASGNRVGTERFQIKNTGSGWEATGELQVEASGSRVSEASILRLDAALNPQSYHRTQKSPLTATLEVKFGGRAETTLTSNAGQEPFEQAFFLPENDLAVLDTNLFHHYAVLLLRYDRAKGGPQPFNVFIPQEALPGAITVAFVATESSAGGIELDHYRASTEELEIEIWVTPGGALQRISIPSAGLEITRQ